MSEKGFSNKNVSGVLQIEDGAFSPFDGDNSGSDPDDDFDDRYIHLIAAHAELHKTFGVIYPDSTSKGIWDLICLVFIIYQSILVPFRLCFEEEAYGAVYIFENIIDFSFMTDIVISFNTGFYKKGYLVMKRKEIIKNYLFSWFFLDLIASFPYSLAFRDMDIQDITDQNSISYTAP